MMRAAVAASIAAMAFCAQAQVLVNGAGATFPFPIYSVWFDQFHRLRPDAAINYQPVGSRAGIRQLQAGVLDFGASDMPLGAVETPAGRAGILSFPTVIGAVVLIYNLPGISKELDFTPETLAGVLLGNIERWNDPRISAVNPLVALPPERIVPVHRSDGSGSTYILSEFLTKSSADWRAEARTGALINWRAGIGAKGNEGVAGIVKQTRYSVGYAELAYALENRIPYARVRNAAGRLIKADAGSIRAAAAADQNSMPENLEVSITNAPGKDSYPIASYTWLLTPSEIKETAKRRIVIDFLRWMLRDGQNFAEALGYAPLPKAVAAKALKACDRIH